MSKTKFIIKQIDNTGYTYFVGNGFYRVQGEKYFVSTETRSEAKRYTTFAKAQSAANTLSRSCANGSCRFEIEEIDDEQGKHDYT